MIAIVGIRIARWRKPCSARICRKFRGRAGRNGQRVSVGLRHRSAAGLLLLTPAAALAAIVPVALAIGVDPAYIVARAGMLWLPCIPADLPAIPAAMTSLTVPAQPSYCRFCHNHSFILPGLIGVSVSCVFGWILPQCTDSCNGRARRPVMRAAARDLEPRP